jgi:hypothetical protein
MDKYVYLDPLFKHNFVIYMSTGNQGEDDVVIYE